MEFKDMRKDMVERHLITRGIKDTAVLNAFERVERHKFIPAEFLDASYADHPLPIGNGQTISQPYIVALMTESLNIATRDKVLEIGTGSGYQAAILAELASRVYSMERIPVLAQKAARRLREMGYNNIEMTVGDGSLGWKEHAPYDAIMITASLPGEPQTLLSQLTNGGRLVAPIGSAFGQALTLFFKKNHDIESRQICGCVFVPLIGKEGWEK